MTTHYPLQKAWTCRIVGLSSAKLYRPKVNWFARGKEAVDALNAIIAKRARWRFLEMLCGVASKALTVSRV